MIKIKPAQGFIQIQIDQTKIAGLDTSSVKSISPWGTIIAIGNNTQTDFQVGQKVFFTPAMVDVVSKGNDTFYFIAVDSKGILATYEE